MSRLEQTEKLIYSAASYTAATTRVAYDKSYDWIKRWWNEEDVNKPEIERMSRQPGLVEQFTTFFSSPTHVVDNLYIGSAFNAAAYNDLKELKVGMIINVTREISRYFPSDFVYKQYPIYDDNDEPITEHLDSAYDDIIKFQEDHPDDKILIHCYMGASRSASVVIHYLIKKKGMTFDDALTFLKQQRRTVNPTRKLADDIKNTTD